MQQQPFAPVEEPEAEEIVVEEGEQGTHDDIDKAEAGVAFADDHLRAEQGVAVHMLDVVGERGIGVVDQSPVGN